MNNSFTGDELKNLGMIYHKGIGVEQDYNRASGYYERAAKFNNPDALYNLGEFYWYGYGVVKDYCKAREYYERAAALNQPDALYTLGNFYYGNVVSDNARAREYYERAAAFNHPDALYSLGKIYEFGKGVPASKAKSTEYYEKAAELNQVNALLILGDRLSIFNHEEKSVRAREYFEKAIQLNNDDDSAIFKIKDDYYTYFLRALLNLGQYYLRGIGVERDYIKARKYFERIIKLNIGNRGPASFDLGQIYLDGLGVEQDCLKAREYFNIADSEGYFMTEDQEEKLIHLEEEKRRLDEDKRQHEEAKQLPERNNPESFPADNLNVFAERLRCPVCTVNAVNMVINECGHLICFECINNPLFNNSCPMCRIKPITVKKIIYGGYKQKYLKYKNKYLKLKK
jgi:TPR repeat protein